MGNGFSSLHKAVEQNDLSALCIEIQSNSSQINDQEDEHKLTALMMACAKGYGPFARELLRRGAAMDLTDKVGRTALHHACLGGHVECVKALIFPDHPPAKPARRDLRDKDGRSCYDLINMGTNGGAAVAALMGGGGPTVAAAAAAAFTPPQSGTSSPSYAGRDGAAMGPGGFSPARLYPPVPGMVPYPPSPAHHLPQQQQNTLASSNSVPASAATLPAAAGMVPRGGSEPNLAPYPSPHQQQLAAPPGYYPPPQSYSWQGPPGQQAPYPPPRSFLLPQQPQQRQQQQVAPREDPDGGWGQESSDDWGSGAPQTTASSARMSSSAAAAPLARPPLPQAQQHHQPACFHPKPPDGDDPPSIFICPITADVMVDPVFAADGFTYEHSAIAEWIAKAGTSPLTNVALPHLGLVPNHTLRSAIREWTQQHKARS